MRTVVLVYLPTKLGDFVRANVGVHIPAPWSIWVSTVVNPAQRLTASPILPWIPWSDRIWQWKLPSHFQIKISSGYLT